MAAGVYRHSRLLLENTAKEMGYTALCDKPKKEAVFLGKDVFVSMCDSPDSTRCCVNRLRLLESSGSEQQHSKHHFMAMKSSRMNFNNTKEQIITKFQSCDYS